MSKDIEGWVDLPEHVREAFDKAFEDNPKTKKIRSEILKAQAGRKYVTALQLSNQLLAARQDAQKTLLSEKRTESEQISLLELGLEDKYVELINVLSIAMYMACDMLEFFSMDINEIVKRKDPTASFDMFDPIIKVGKEAKGNLNYLWKNTNMFDSECFADNSDDIRQMLVNKAKKVYKDYQKRKGNG